jgi:hypothetical protein
VFRGALACQTLSFIATTRGKHLAGLLTAALTAALYAYAGQIVTVYGDGTVYVDTEPTHLAALVVLSLLMGLLLPLQAFALRRAAWGLRQGSTGVVGLVAGLGSLSCCSPLILPTVLSFAGFSGTSLLTMNVTLYRYFLPLAALSVAFLLLSLLLAARDVARVCASPPRRERQAGGERRQTRPAPGRRQAAGAPVPATRTAAALRIKEYRKWNRPH